ncbi:hypothetical protein LEMLEM_LOCUS7175, partial [Lemmus lemmus]
SAPAHAAALRPATESPPGESGSTSGYRRVPGPSDCELLLSRDEAGRAWGSLADRERKRRKPSPKRPGGADGVRMRAAGPREPERPLPIGCVDEGLEVGLEEVWAGCGAAARRLRTGCGSRQGSAGVLRFAQGKPPEESPVGADDPDDPTFPRTSVGVSPEFYIQNSLKTAGLLCKYK